MPQKNSIQPRRLKEDDLTTLLEVLRLAPSAYGLQPFKSLSNRQPCNSRTT